MFTSFKDSVAIYLRKSRMDPESESIDETLARHTDTLMKTATRLELNVVKIYKEVVSGDGLFTRPQMLHLLHDIEEDMYSAVLCVEIDRLGRSSQKDGGIILETFQEHNVFIITPNKTYDLNNEFDEQSVEMQSFIARQELKSIRRRLRKGAEKTVEQGGHITEPPYGYRRVYIDKHPTLEICDEEADVIRMIFDMYVNQGMGGQLIADRLNEMGLSPRKNDHFTRSTVQWYLQNPIYIGKIVWNKRRHVKKKFPTDKHRSVINPTDKWIVTNGIHRPIISNELFDRAQEIRTLRAHPPSYIGEIKNPFAGLIYCKNCGAAMQRQFSSQKGERLLCVSKGCMRSMRMDFVEQRVINMLKTVLERCRTPILSEAKSEDVLHIEALKKSIQKLEREITTMQKQKSSLHDLLERGVYDIATFLERSNILAERLSDAESHIREQYKELSETEDIPTITEAIPIFSRLAYEYDTLSAAEKNVLYKQLIKRIIYNRTSEHKQNDFDIEIQWSFKV